MLAASFAFVSVEVGDACERFKTNQEVNIIWFHTEAVEPWGLRLADIRGWGLVGGGGRLQLQERLQVQKKREVGADWRPERSDGCTVQSSIK